MSLTRWLLRWLPTFLAFPLAGLLAVTVVGSTTSVGSAVVAGALAGAVIGTGQWLALRTRGVSPWWVPATAAGMSAGTALAVQLTGAGTGVADLVVTGLVAGAAVGLAQGLVLRSVLLWSGTVALAWAAAWFTTAQVIVDADRGYVVFGASGALLATVVTGLVGHRLLAGRATADETQLATAR